MNAVRKGIVTWSSSLPLLSAESRNVTVRIKEYDLIFMNGLPLGISESRISIHIEQAKVAQGGKKVKVPVAFN